jgi:hypothetical protein
MRDRPAGEAEVEGGFEMVDTLGRESCEAGDLALGEGGAEQEIDEDGTRIDTLRAVAIEHGADGDGGDFGDAGEHGGVELLKGLGYGGGHKRTFKVNDLLDWLFAWRVRREARTEKISVKCNPRLGRKPRPFLNS